MAQVLNFSGIDDSETVKSIDVEIDTPVRTAPHRQPTKIITLSNAVVRLVRSTRKNVKKYFVHGPAQDGILCTLFLDYDQEGHRSGLLQLQPAPARAITSPLRRKAA